MAEVSSISIENIRSFLNQKVYIAELYNQGCFEQDNPDASNYYSGYARALNDILYILNNTPEDIKEDSIVSSCLIGIENGDVYCKLNGRLQFCDNDTNEVISEV